MQALRSRFGLFPEAAVRPGPAVRPRLLVVSQSYNSALVVADIIEGLGFVPVFVAAAEIARAEGLYQPPVAALVLREVETHQKVAVCSFLRAAATYAGKPIVVILALVDGAVSLSADAVLRPPASLADAIAHIRARLEEAGA